MISRTMVRSRLPERGGAAFCALLVLLVLFAAPIQARAASITGIAVTLGASVVVAGALVALGINPSLSSFSALVDDVVTNITALGHASVEGISLIIDTGKYFIPQAVLQDIADYLVANVPLTSDSSYIWPFAQDIVVQYDNSLVFDPSLLLSHFESESWYSYWTASPDWANFCNDFANAEFATVQARDYGAQGIQYVVHFLAPYYNIHTGLYKDVNGSLIGGSLDASGSLSIGGNRYHGIFGFQTVINQYTYSFNYSSGNINIGSRYFLLGSNVGVLPQVGSLAPSAVAPTAAGLDTDYPDWMYEGRTANGIPVLPLSIPATVPAAANLTQAQAQAGNAVPVIEPSTVPWHYVTDTLEAADGAFSVLGVFFEMLPPLIRTGIWALLIATVVFGFFKVVL